MASPNDQDSERQEEAKRILERVKQDSETAGTSSMQRVADQMREHIGAADADQSDWAELWGTRIGRGLGLVFFVFLVIYLTKTYIL